jgi:hypothetical protein
MPQFNQGMDALGNTNQCASKLNLVIIAQSIYSIGMSTNSRFILVCGIAVRKMSVSEKS